MRSERFERSRHAVANVLVRAQPPSATTKWNPSPARLSLGEREEIGSGTVIDTFVYDVFGANFSSRSEQRHGHRRSPA